MPDPGGKAVKFFFEGPILNIYTTLIVRLAYSDFFTLEVKKGIWKNAAIYTTRIYGEAYGYGTYGIYLDNTGRGQGCLTLFFKDANAEMRYLFEQLVERHLKSQITQEHLRRQRIFVCNSVHPATGKVCNYVVSEEIIRARYEQHKQWCLCPICEQRISIVDGEEHSEKCDVDITSMSLVQEAEQSSQERQQWERNASIRKGTIETEHFDVFICYNPENQKSILKIATLLKERNILPWLDIWELRPGKPWQPELEKQIEKITAAAVFIGNDGIAPWQQKQIDAFLRVFVNRDCPVIPVLLKDASNPPPLPLFLQGYTWVDFRSQDAQASALDKLIWGITGQRPFSLLEGTLPI
jgi:hypothetical protein